MATQARPVQIDFYPDRVLKGVEAKMPARMTAIATTYANMVKKMMRDSPATGRTYQRGGKTHRASAPGEPPAPDSGRLLRSVNWRVRHNGLVWYAEVFSTLKYALYLEFGAARGIRHTSGPNVGRLKSVQWVLFPRPAWGPALDQIRPRLAGMLKGKR